LDVSLTAEQRLIGDTAHEFFAREAGPERLRQVLVSAAGWDEALWAALAGDLGLAGLMVPEAFGGAGLGAVEMALVLEQSGGALAVAPFFETAVLAVQLILAVGQPDQQQALLPGLAAGAVRAAVAFSDLHGGVDPAALGAMVRRDGAGWRLDGRARFVTFVQAADLLLVVARQAEGSGHSLLALPAKIAGLSRQPLQSLDPTRPLGDLLFDAVAIEPSMLLGAPGTAGAGVARALAVGAALLAAEHTGGAAACLAATLAYAKDRVQFGRPIGGFQAVKHALADMMAAVESSRSAALYAALAVDQGGDLLWEAASAACAWSSDAYRHCAGQAIQLHGGVGFTWEHQSHLYFKRARASGAWLGAPSLHRERVARLIGLDEPLLETIP
jgi:alkylation response protein AidB-like acyl-CoA dehydrogenase